VTLPSLEIGLSWAILAICGVSGLLAFLGGYWTPGYYTLLRGHVVVGEAALLISLLGVVLHLRRTSSSMLAGLLPVLLGAALAGPAPWAMVLPEEAHDRGPWGYLVDSARSLVAGTLEDWRPLVASCALVLVLALAIATMVVGVLSRTRERAASRWTGASLTLLLTWALVGGHHLADLPVRARVPGQSLHSFAGMWALALTGLHLFAHRAAGSRLPRPLVVALALVGVGLFSWLLQVRMSVARQAFALHPIRMPTEPEELAAFASGAPPFRPVPPAWVSDATTCGASGCHEQATREWGASPHRHSADNAGYRAVVGELISAGRWAEVTFCAGCHDPARVAAGTLLEDYAQGVPPGGDGVSCQFCHSISEVHGDPPANGRLTVWIERPVPGPDPVANLRLDARHHRDRFVFNSEIYRPRHCQACHRVELGHEVLQWQDMPATDAEGEPLDCRTCHLPPQDELIYSHRMAGLHLDQDRTVGGDGDALARHATHRAAVQAFTGFRSDLPLTDPGWRRRVDWDPSRPGGGGGAPLALDVRASLAPPDRIEGTAVLRNLGVGHAWPSGPFDLQEHWLELLVTDATGAPFFHQGALDGAGRIIDTVDRLGGRELDAEGRPIVHHRILEIASVVDRAAVAPGERRESPFVVTLPPDRNCPCELRARWRFRRWNPDFSAWALGTSRPLPTWEVAAAWAVVRPSSGRPPPPGAPPP
jgi:hypothetical protein